MLFVRTAVSAVLLLCFAISAAAQTETATVSGRVTDDSGAVVTAADVRLQSVDRGDVVKTLTNGGGIYVLPGVRPGRYRLAVQKDGFRHVDVLDLVVNIQDRIEQNVRLQVGSVNESITVSGAAPIVNTENGAVSTVVDHSYVANVPLNGRTLQGLILLTPGIVTNSPQSGSSASIGQQGEFSVNGQRTESNSYAVDGVSANNGAIAGIFASFSSAASGSLPAATALGTSQGLVSLDALEEFRVQSSSYSAEFGRTPGGQFSFVSRSGTNKWHGSMFDYLRNGVVDANDWFNNYFQNSQPPVKQNDFGGTIGGPIPIPGVYNGKDRTFFFLSYEGLRVVQPQASSISFVPDLQLRQTVPAPLQQVLTAFPLPNGPSFGNGLAPFTGSWSNPSRIDSGSIRLDHRVGDRVRVFFRLSDTPSRADQRLNGTLFSAPSNKLTTKFSGRTYTLGTTISPKTNFSNEFRLNYASNSTSQRQVIDGFGGATPVSLTGLQGVSSANAGVNVDFFFTGFSSGIASSLSSGLQRQWNVVDTVNVAKGHHQFKFGIDYRRLTPVGQASTPNINYFFFSPSSLQSSLPDVAFSLTLLTSHPLFQNFSVFGEDEWRVNPRLNLSMGLRWEVNPAPGVTEGIKPYTVMGSNLSNFTLAQQGTPLWQTAWFNFAPRLGAAYVLHDRQNWTTVLRGGGGLFFDTAQQTGAAGFQGIGFRGFFAAPAGTSFPFPASDASPVIQNPPVAPFSDPVFGFPPHLQLPYTIQWNVALQQSLGAAQALTLSYVGSHAGRLIEENEVQGGAPLPNFAGGLLLIQSGLTSDYHSLQTQIQRRITGGLQALASYTWSHSIDYGSSNAAFPYRRGNSDFDVRHNVSGSLTYDVAGHFKSTAASTLLGHWGFDTKFNARTAFPVTLDGITRFVDPTTLTTYRSGLDLVSGQPVYVRGAQCTAVYGNGLPCPGGRAINPNAFAVPASGFGSAPRNFARGFGAWQIDFAVRREFPIYEGVKLQFRAEAFNILNHPNFGTINPFFCSPGPGCTFGQAQATLAQSLGILSPIYQMGGSRSMQFALKLLF